MKTSIHPEKARRLIESVIIIVFATFTGLITKWLTGDPTATLLAAMITTAQLVTSFKIDALERKIDVHAKTILA